MRLATVAESRRIDQLAQERFDLSADVLMEAAGALTAREILQTFVVETRAGGPVAVVCGPGNNGGDGLVVARHLSSAGVRVITIYLVGPADKRSAFFDSQLERCRKAGLEIIESAHGSLPDFEKHRLVIDAIFGIGLNTEVRGPFRVAIETMNQSQAATVSLDTPSGLDADRGVELGLAVRAQQTFTFGLAKPGFFITDGPACTGRLKVLPIGFPMRLVQSEAASTFAVTEKIARRNLPRRQATGNKFTSGQALIIAGHPGMWGAALLSASSAYRMGAGYVTLTSPTKQPTDVLKTYPEILTSTIDDVKLWDDPKWKAAGIGPGLGASDASLDQIERVLRKLIEMRAEKVVVDADAITAIAKRKIWPIPESWVLTPHTGELSRILNIDSKTIEADRIRYAREAAEKLGCHVLLKGFRTVLASGSGSSKGRAWIILSGNSALAKAGTGDVLTGMITGLLAQGLDPLPAAATAAYLHGRLANEWVRSGLDRRSLQASDLREFLPALLQRL